MMSHRGSDLIENWAEENVQSDLLVACFMNHEIVRAQIMRVKLTFLPMIVTFAVLEPIGLPPGIRDK